MDVQIGTTVLWYANGDRNATPVVSLVVGYAGPGQVRLVRIPANGGEMTSVRCVYHVDDEQLRMQPVLRTKYGGWDHIGSDNVPKQTPAAARPAVQPVQPATPPPAKKKPGRPKKSSTMLDEARHLIKNNGATLLQLEAMYPSIEKEELAALFEE